ncbi:serine acetyltransferase [Christensenellaceae bacterium OttesenSCG-928-K19]|nr:serine acetyltransferase [Christensenellaceae bacterium OttesenSCG-928-K19]
MGETWQGFDEFEVAQQLIKINERNITKDTISGFGMKAKVAALVDDLRSALFPNIYDTKVLKGEELTGAVCSRLKKAAVLLDCMVAEVLVNRCEAHRHGEKECDKCRGQARSITVQFMSGLTAIAKVLDTDIQAAYDGDPAAMSREEIMLAYPGFEAVLSYRFAHALYNMHVPLLPRMFTELAHSSTGIDIHPGATIGNYFFIDHGTGVVIGETCTIGDHVKIYQGVTLGAKSFELDEHGNPVKGVKRHPDIEDDVIIYSGASILGGDTRIGKGSIIGGNVWLMQSVEPYSTVYNATPSPLIKNGGAAT